MTIQTVSNEKPAETPAPAPEADKATTPAGKEAPASQETPPASAPTEEDRQNEPEKSEISGTETEEGNEPETEGAESLESDAQKVEGQTEEKPKKKSGFQKRIDKLNARYADKEREAEYWRQQALKTAPKADPRVEPAKLATAEGEPQPETFDDHKSYVKALTKWETKQLLAEERQGQERSRLQTEQANQAKTYSERAKVFSEAHPDFDDVIAEVGEMPISPTVQAILLSSENGPAMAYELAKNPEEARRILGLSPLQAALEMGVLKSRIASKASAEKKQETKRVTSAPSPLAPVGGGGKATAPKKSLDELAKTDFAAFKKAREEGLKQSRRRAQT